MPESASFEKILTASNRIQDDELIGAITYVRHRRTGMEDSNCLLHLANIVRQLDRNALGWFEAVLCARSEQCERNAKGRLYAPPSYRELL